jgi:hypothetical protein
VYGACAICTLVAIALGNYAPWLVAVPGRAGDFAPYLVAFAAIEEVVLSKIYEITRPGFVVIVSARRAFLQFLHHDHTQSPLAGCCSVRSVTIENVAACAMFYWAGGLFRS